MWCVDMLGEARGDGWKLAARGVLRNVLRTMSPEVRRWRIYPADISGRSPYDVGSQAGPF